MSKYIIENIVNNSVEIVDSRINNIKSNVAIEIVDKGIS